VTGDKATIKWRHSSSTCLKNSECKNPLENFFSLVFRDQDDILLIDYLPKGTVLLISAGATEGYFEGKTPQKFHQGYFVLARQCPGSPGTCNPEDTELLGFQMS
jgi:hypothetical protein